MLFKFNKGFQFLHHAIGNMLSICHSRTDNSSQVLELIHYSISLKHFYFPKTRFSEKLSFNVKPIFLTQNIKLYFNIIVYFLLIIEAS